MLKVTIHGRVTVGFWIATALSVFLMGFGVAVLVLFQPDGHVDYSNMIFLLCSILMSAWFFYIVAPRQEEIAFDRKELTTRSSFRLFGRRVMPTSKIRDFILKRAGLREIRLGTLAFDAFPLTGRQFLFAVDEPDYPKHDLGNSNSDSAFKELDSHIKNLFFGTGGTWLVLGIQARSEDLSWLQALLSDHLQKLISRGTVNAGD